MRPPRPTARAACALLALVLLAAGSGAAAVTWTATSTLTTSATAPPVELQVGAGGAKTAYFPSLALGANRTLLAGSVSAKAGADLVVKDVVRVVSRSDLAQSVTLSASQVANARVEVLAWTVFDGATRVGVLDLRAAAPSVTFSLPAGASRTLDLRVDLADGAGADDASFTVGLRLGVAAGGIALAHPSGLPLAPAPVAAPFGRLAAGSAVGLNATNGSASVAGALLTATTDVLYVNNTDPVRPVFARLVLASSSGLAGLLDLQVGIQNASGRTPQVTSTSGSVTQSSGSYVRLEPASTNRIYVTQTAALLFSGATVSMDMHVADDAAESARAVSKLVVSVT